MFGTLSVLKGLVLTEKSHSIKESNTYVFKVDSKADKDAIAKAIKHIYNIEPISIRTLTTLKLKKKSRSKVKQRYKKAYIKFPNGFSININS
jgi:ribosomal protein L23